MASNTTLVGHFKASIFARVESKFLSVVAVIPVVATVGDSIAR